MKILFVCLGNICRSPAADGVLHKMVKEQGLANSISIDSAGTSAYHAGEPADARMRDHAAKRGYDLTSISRQFIVSDFKNFDLIVPMDESNYFDIQNLDSRRESMHKVVPFTNYCEIHDIKAVPDPYFGGHDGFELVMDIIEDGCKGLLKEIKKKL